LVISLTFIPAVLSLIPVKQRTTSSGSADEIRGLTRIMDEIGRQVLKNENR